MQSYKELIVIRKDISLLSKFIRIYKRLSARAFEILL